MVEDVPIIDFVNFVQADAVKAGLTGSAASLPVLSIAAPFNRSASFPAGEVTVRDVAGLYIYDNTLLGVQVSGADVKAYLEYSARYFKQVTGTGPFTMAQVTNAVTPTAPNGTPDYNFDSVAGLDAPLTYDIDIASRSARGSSACRTTARRSPTRNSSCWRSTTTASPAAAASRPSPPRPSSTTARTRSASC